MITVVVDRCTPGRITKTLIISYHINTKSQWWTKWRQSWPASFHFFVITSFGNFTNFHLCNLLFASNKSDCKRFGCMTLDAKFDFNFIAKNLYFPMSKLRLMCFLLKLVFLTLLLCMNRIASESTTESSLGKLSSSKVVCLSFAQYVHTTDYNFFLTCIQNDTQTVP